VSADNDRTIVSRRRLAAPREQVFRAFAEPQRLARWWGPQGFRNTFQTFEFRPGGRWTFVMHGPDGTDYPNDVSFELIEPPAHIVLRHHPQPGFRLYVSLGEAGGATDVEWQQVFDSPDLKRKLEAICRPANEQNFDRLEAELASPA
jgi:uncharacterized protein YndB with AHSA1/START domain